MTKCNFKVGDLITLKPGIDSEPHYTYPAIIKEVDDHPCYNGSFKIRVEAWTNYETWWVYSSEIKMHSESKVRRIHECSCDKYDLFWYGCKCGYFEQEQEDLKEKENDKN